MQFQVSTVAQQEAYGKVDMDAAVEVGKQAINLLGSGIAGLKAKKEAEKLAAQRALEEQQMAQQHQYLLQQQGIEGQKAALLLGEKDKKRTQMLIAGGIGALTLIGGAAIYFLVIRKK
jgi:hypothetical protein